ncbi:ankyrin, partial [Morchella conica CCBAS932]
NDAGAAALHRACLNGHREVVEVLLSHGADIEAMNNARMTALGCAYSKGHGSVVEMLLSHESNIKSK